jgi:hypothetical protein
MDQGKYTTGVNTITVDLVQTIRVQEIPNQKTQERT